MHKILLAFVFMLGVFALADASEAQTPTPAACARASGPNDVYPIKDRRCTPECDGPTVGQCCLGVVDSQLVFKCGTVLKQVLTGVWPLTNTPTATSTPTSTPTNTPTNTP